MFFVQFKRFFLSKVLPRPNVMELILMSDAKELHKEKQGIYFLKDKLINNHPYWEQQNGTNALWFQKFYGWMVGPKTNLGHDIGGIIGPKGIDRSPTKILNGWKYAANGLWKDAASSEIMIKDLSPGML